MQTINVVGRVTPEAIVYYNEDPHRFKDGRHVERTQDCFLRSISRVTLTGVGLAVGFRGSRSTEGESEQVDSLQERRNAHHE